MTEKPTSAIGLLNNWREGGDFVHFVFSGDPEYSSFAFSTVVRVTSIGSQLEVFISDTLVKMVFPIDIGQLALGDPVGEIPLLDKSLFAKRLRYPSVVMNYGKYAIVLNEFS